MSTLLMGPVTDRMTVSIPHSTVDKKVDRTVDKTGHRAFDFFLQANIY